MTTEERFLLLSALIDREEVDPEALALALDDPEGRAQLVDFVRLRVRVHGELMDPPAATPTLSRGNPSSRTWMVRAALVLLPLALGAAGGAWWVERRESQPPTPTRIVQFVPGVDWK